MVNRGIFQVESLHFFGMSQLTRRLTLSPPEAGASSQSAETHSETKLSPETQDRLWRSLQAKAASDLAKRRAVAEREAELVRERQRRADEARLVQERERAEREAEEKRRLAARSLRERALAHRREHQRAKARFARNGSASQSHLSTQADMMEDFEEGGAL